MSSNFPGGSAAATQTAPARARTQPIILIAEDSADGREMMSVLLGLRGYEVLSAEDGIQAVEVALAHLPDLILIDLELPQLDGIGVTRKLRLDARFHETPIIIVSGHDPARHRQAAIEAGCTDYLLKPIDFDRLDVILNRSIPLAAAHER